jgi:type IV pilus assembly protein PilE
MPTSSPRSRHGGFTLIEVLMAVVIIGILSAIAFPSYVDYVMRGKISEATAGLANMRVQMEQYFQDNRTYAAVAPNPAPCTAGSAVPLPANTKYFTFTCALAANTFTITATGIAGNGMDGFVFTVNEQNAQQTQISGEAAKVGFVTNTGCWVVRKGAGTKAC